MPVSKASSCSTQDAHSTLGEHHLLNSPIIRKMAREQGTGQAHCSRLRPDWSFGTAAAASRTGVALNIAPVIRKVILRRVLLMYHIRRLSSRPLGTLAQWRKLCSRPSWLHKAVRRLPLLWRPSCTPRSRCGLRRLSDGEATKASGERASNCRVPSQTTSPGSNPSIAMHTLFALMVVAHSFRSTSHFEHRSLPSVEALRASPDP